MNYESFIEEELRLNILLILQDIPQGSATDSVLDSFLIKLYGHNGNVVRLCKNLRWLNERGFLELEALTADTFKATITTAGERIAKGIEYFPEIKRPKRKG